MSEEGLKRTSVFGHTVEYSEDCRDAVRYLRDDIQSEEAHVFFEQARYRGEAEFETDKEGQFTLKHHGGIYSVEKRETHSSGWF